MTVWAVVGIWLGVAAYIVAWFWGGRPERFGAAVMLLHFAVAVMSYVFRWEFNGIHLPRMIVDYIRVLIFVWLCFRSDRWWPFLMTAALGLMVLVDVVGLVSPTISQWGAGSAKVGLGLLTDLTLMFSVCERLLAGEPPARWAAWARADVATAARRNRNKSPRSEVAGNLVREKRTDSR